MNWKTVELTTTVAKVHWALLGVIAFGLVLYEAIGSVFSALFIITGLILFAVRAALGVKLVVDFADNPKNYTSLGHSILKQSLLLYIGQGYQVDAGFWGVVLLVGAVLNSWWVYLVPIIGIISSIAIYGIMFFYINENSGGKETT